MHSKARKAWTRMSATAWRAWSTGSSHATRSTRVELRNFWASGISLVHDAEALEGEPGLIVLDGAGVRHDQLRQPAGGDDRRHSELALEPIDDRVDLTTEAVHRARLDGLDRRLADHVLRRHQLHAPERSRACEQRVERDLDARKDRAPEILTLLAHRVDGVRGAEVDHDGGAAVQVVRADGIGDAVSTDVLRLVVEDRHAGADPRLEHQRREAEVALGHRPKRGS